MVAVTDMRQSQDVDNLKALQAVHMEQPAATLQASAATVVDPDHTGHRGSGCHFDSQHSVVMQLCPHLRLRSEGGGRGQMGRPAVTLPHAETKTQHKMD